MEGSLGRAGKQHLSLDESEITPVPMLLWRFCLHPQMYWLECRKPDLSPACFLPEGSEWQPRPCGIGGWQSGIWDGCVVVVEGLVCSQTGGEDSLDLSLAFKPFFSGIIAWDLRPSAFKYIRRDPGLFTYLELWQRGWPIRSPFLPLCSYAELASSFQNPTALISASFWWWQSCSNSGLFWEDFWPWYAQFCPSFR